MNLKNAQMINDEIIKRKINKLSDIAVYGGVLSA